MLYRNHIKDSSEGIFTPHPDPLPVEGRGRNSAKAPFRVAGDIQMSRSFLQATKQPKEIEL
jgi:hypothetical protein